MRSWPSPMNTTDDVALRIPCMEQLESHLPVETRYPTRGRPPRRPLRRLARVRSVAPTSQTRHRPRLADVRRRGSRSRWPCPKATSSIRLKRHGRSVFARLRYRRGRGAAESRSVRRRHPPRTPASASPAADLQRCRGRQREARDPYQAVRESLSFISMARRTSARWNGHSCGIGGRLGQRVRNFVVGAPHLDACNHGFAVRRFQPLECALVSFQRLAADCFFERGC